MRAPPLASLDAVWLRMSKQGSGTCTQNRGARWHATCCLRLPLKLAAMPLKRIPINLMHSRPLSASWWGAAILGLPRFRSLVRGVSNHGAAHPSRRALRNDCVSRKCTYLRPPQDEADTRPATCHLDSLRPGTAL